MNLAIPNEIKKNLKEEVSVQDKISKWENTKEKKQVIEAFTKLFPKKRKIPETQTQSIQLRNIKPMKKISSFIDNEGIKHQFISSIFGFSSAKSTNHPSVLINKNPEEKKINLSGKSYSCWEPTSAINTLEYLEVEVIYQKF